jgi:hypothetical protein
MPPQYLLLVLGGSALIVVGTIWLLYRLGGFTPTAMERRGWLVAVPIILVIMVVMAFIGPLPWPVVLGMNAALVVYWLWSWRTRRLGLDRVPADMREEAALRREWMRSHRGTLAAVMLGGWLILIVWVFVVILVIAR